MSSINNKNKNRFCIYDGTEMIVVALINNNLDFFNGQHNCNPERGKHKTLVPLKDGRFAIIYIDDIELKKMSRIVTNEEALREIIRAKKTKLLTLKKYATLCKLYDENPNYWDSFVDNSKKVGKKRLEEIYAVFSEDNFLVGIYSQLKTLKVKCISEMEEVPGDFIKIWKP
jgi:hypothetical protein